MALPPDMTPRAEPRPPDGGGLIMETWKPQHVWLAEDDEYICWTSPIKGFDGLENERVLATGMLDQFLNIGSAQDVLRFAARYGVLSLCEPHGWPSTHRLANYDSAPPGRPAPTELPLCSPQLAATRRHGVADRQEPIKGWMQLVAEARRAVLIANWLIGEADPWVGPEPRAWERQLPMLDDLPPDPLKGREAVEQTINRWFRLGVVRPTLTWVADADLPTLAFASDVFGCLTLQLALEVSRTRGLVACSGCGRFYRRLLRAPKKGQAHYCPDCREKGAGLLFRKRRQNGRLPK